MKKRLLSILMVCSMILGMMPAVSYAETGEADEGTAAVQTDEVSTKKAISIHMGTSLKS